MKVLDIGVAQALQIIFADALLHRDAALLNSLQQGRRRRLQPHDQVGLGHARRDLRVHLRVEPVFLIAQVEPGEQGVLGEQEIADDAARKHALLRQGLHLLDALEQKEQLRLERVAEAVVVEALEEGVVVGLLKQQLGTELLSQAARKRALADADRTFDDDVAEAIGQLCRSRCGVHGSIFSTR